MLSVLVCRAEKRSSWRKAERAITERSVSCCEVIIALNYQLRHRGLAARVLQLQLLFSVLLSRYQRSFHFVYLRNYVARNLHITSVILSLMHFEVTYEC